MRIYLQKDLVKALSYAESGGQSLYLWTPSTSMRAKAPKVFRVAAAPWGKLFDQDQDRLTKTAKKYGVRRIKIDRPGERGQHIDLCETPLLRALMRAENPDADPQRSGRGAWKSQSKE